MSEDRYAEDPRADQAQTDDEGGSWWDEGLITLLLVGGLALFLFPEPVTSAVGLVLMGAGVVLGIIDWLT